MLRSGTMSSTPVPPPPVGDALPLSQYLQLPTAPETWLIEPLIPAGGLVNIYSAPKVGKSFLALDLARALSDADETWLGFTVSMPGPVLYVQLDTPRSLWIDRFHKLQEAGIPFSDQFYVADIGQAPYPFKLDEEHCATWLRKQCDTIKPVLVVIDTTREAHQGDENDSKHMQRVIASLIVATRPAACLLVSHSRKLQMSPEGVAESSLMDDNRGSGYIPGRMDTIIQLRGKEGAKSCTMVYQGRAVEHGQLTLHRTDHLLWNCLTDAFHETAKAFLDGEYPSLRARARALAEASGESPERCYSTLQRLQKKALQKR